MSMTWVPVRQGLPLADPLGRPLTTETPEPPRGPRRDMAFLQAQNEMSRRSCAALATRVYGEIIVPRSSTVMPADPRPTHDGWPRGVIGGWSS